MNFATVHIAGEIENGLQRCQRCGHVLIDYRGQHVMMANVEPGSCPQLSFWEPGRMVGIAGAGSFLLPDRPLDPDEASCSTARPQ